MAQEFFVTFNIEKQEVQVADFSLQNHAVNGSFQMRTNERDHENLYNRDKNDQHPISAITGLEQIIEELRTHEQGFVFEQGVSASEWRIQHTLNKYASVTIVDEYNRIIDGEVTYLDENNIIISFNGSIKGKAYLN